MSPVLVLEYYTVLNYSYPRYAIFPHGDIRSSIDEPLYRHRTVAFLDNNPSESKLWGSYWEPEVGAYAKNHCPAEVPIPCRMAFSRSPKFRLLTPVTLQYLILNDLVSQHLTSCNPKATPVRAATLPYTQALDTIHE